MLECFCWFEMILEKIMTHAYKKPKRWSANPFVASIHVIKMSNVLHHSHFLYYESIGINLFHGTGLFLYPLKISEKY